MGRPVLMGRLAPVARLVQVGRLAHVVRLAPLVRTEKMEGLAVKAMWARRENLAVQEDGVETKNAGRWPQALPAAALLQLLEQVRSLWSWTL